MVTKEERCSQRVPGSGPWGVFHQHQCEKKAVIERDGKLYCKIHDPEYIEAKNTERTAKWDVEFSRKMARGKLESTAVSQCRLVNPDNPQAVAESIKEMYEALKLYKAHQQGTRGHYCSGCEKAVDKAIAKATEAL